MPEGPTIRLLAEETQQFVGKKVISATTLTDDLDLSRFEGQKIREIKSYGKQLLIVFDDFAVRIHLMLFGYYEINDNFPKGKLRLGLRFKNSELNFYAADVRFIEEPINDLYDWRLDVLSPDFDKQLAVDKLNSLDKEFICDALLDQSIFAGVGNIIKNDMLFKAKVHPLSKSTDVPDAKKLELAEEAVIVSVDFLEWKRSKAKKNKFVAHYKKICPRDKVPFKKLKVGRGKRVCYFCELCQVKY
ncbi:MAG: DNA-formamidopyrimidine glycosylase family protein [Bacteroidota bacterium]